MQFIENGSIMEYKYLIIPDIHGRTFWRKPLEALAERVESIIFLGDYFDPYPSEGIGEDDAIENWKEMTIFIDDNGLSERTTMLIGNHDAHYLNNIFGIYGGSTRKSMEHKTEIASLLRERNLVLAFDGKTEGKKVLFTHAGVNHNWFLRHEKQIGSLTADNINTLTDNDEGWVALSEVGSIRGGFHPTGVHCGWMCGNNITLLGPTAPVPMTSKSSATPKGESPSLRMISLCSTVSSVL